MEIDDMIVNGWASDNPPALFVGSERGEGRERRRESASE